MKRLVDSATEATSLEAALAVEETQAVDLTLLVRERAAVFREAYPERRLLPVIEANVLVEGNEDRLVQLLDKLLENAVQHTYPGGEIRMALKREHGCALLAVENNGDALPPNRDALFDAFVTVGAGEEGQNLGLGLFVAKAIAESHGGTITARDRQEGRGARFEVRLHAR
jgi:signal transduction histidine kinase